MRISYWSSDVCSSDLVDASLSQAVLDEWATRCSSHGIRNPAGCLFGIIQRAIHGEFNAWAKKDAPSAYAPPNERPPPAPPPSQQIGRASCRERVCRVG